MTHSSLARLVLCAGLLAFTTLALTVPAFTFFGAQATVETGSAPPPEGRPPTGALTRTQSRRWEITLSLDLPELRRRETVEEALIVPVSVLDTWWRVDPRSFRTRVSVDFVPVPPTQFTITVAPSRFGESRVEIPIPNVIEQRLTAELAWTVEVWSCALDEARASKIAWPAAWPDEVQRFRSASAGINSQDPLIQGALREISSRLPEQLAPLYAAKEIIRAGSRILRNADHSEGGMAGSKSRGVVVWGATQALSSHIGGEADVTCICLALLRAAGFPARPVIGLAHDRSRRNNASNADKLSLWGEVFLPECGWVPFDAAQIRGGISAQTPVTQQWNGFGTDRDFDERVPITHELDLYTPKASDIGRTASFAALCRLKTKLEQPGQGPTDILIQTSVVSRGRGDGGP